MKASVLSGLFAIALAACTPSQAPDSCDHERLERAQQELAEVPPERPLDRAKIAARAFGSSCSDPFIEMAASIAADDYRRTERLLPLWGWEAARRRTCPAWGEERFHRSMATTATPERYRMLWEGCRFEDANLLTFEEYSECPDITPFVVFDHLRTDGVDRDVARALSRALCVPESKPEPAPDE